MVEIVYILSRFCSLQTDGVGMLAHLVLLAAQGNRIFALGFEPHFSVSFLSSVIC